MNPDVLAAFFSGISAVLSALVALHVAGKRAEKECDKRIREVREAMHEGWKMHEEEQP